MSNVKVKLNEFYELQKQLKEIKEKEKKLRLYLLETVFASSPLEGTETRFKDDIKIKASFKLNYKLDIESYDAVKSLLTEEEKECIVWKPAIHLPSYRKLNDDDRVTLDECVVVTEALPSLKIEYVEAD